VLRIEIWHSGALRVLADEQGIPVLTHGQAEILPD
jgi:hypothetical protein